MPSLLLASSKNLCHRLNISLSVYTLYEGEFTKISPLRHTLDADGIGCDNGVCIQSAVLLGGRGTLNIWPFASYAAQKSRAELILERVSVDVLRLRAAVYDETSEIMREMSVIDVDALLSGTSGIGIEEEKEEMKVKYLPNELLLDMLKAGIGHERRIGPDDGEMSNSNHAFKEDDDDESIYVNERARRFSKHDKS